MVVTNDEKFTWNNGGPKNSKNASASSISSVTSKATTTTKALSAENESHINRLESMTDEEFIQKNLKELMDKKHQEERKANGRLVAVILASLVIFLAIYHAWIRNSRMLTGILVPAVIMLSFAAWVVVLAKRDKAKRQIFEKYLQEVALKNKQELMKAKSKSKSNKSKHKKSSNNVLLHYENEINNEQIPLTHFGANGKETKTTTSILKSKDHRKHRKHRNSSNSDGYSTTSSSSSCKQSSHYATKDLRVKRPSIRQKLFRQTGFYHMPDSSPKATHTLVQAVINTPVPQCMPPMINEKVIQSPATLTLLETKRKRLQKLDSLQVPTMVRMSSAP